MPMSGAGIASYMTITNGNVSDASVWALIDSASFVDQEATNHIGTYNTTSILNSSTSYQKSSTWAYVASPPTIDGIAIRISSTTGVGTLTVALDLANVDVAGTVVTCNCSDLPTNGWIFLKFSAPVTLTTATYSVKVKTSTTVAVVYKTLSGSNFCHFLRTTTTGTAPVAGASQNDNMYILGEITAPGTISNRVMGWDIISNTYPYNHICIAGYATVNIQNLASTDYYMHFQVDMAIYSDATLNIGSSGTPLASSSTFTMTFHFPTAQNINLVIYRDGTLNCYGKVKGTVHTTLASNANSGATSISVNAATDWALGDQIMIANSTSSTADMDRCIITSISGTTIGLADPLADTHTIGTNEPVEVINVTRNLKLQGFSDTIQGAIACLGGNLNLHHVEMWQIGSAYPSMCGLFLQAAAGNVIDIQNCSIWEGQSQSQQVYFSSISGPITFNNNVLYDYGSDGLVTPLSTTFTGSLEVDNNVIMRASFGGARAVVWGLGLPTATFTNNAIVAPSGSEIGEIAAFELTAVGTPGEMSGNRIHGGGGYGLSVKSVQTFSNTLNWISSNWNIYDMQYGLTLQTELTHAVVFINGLRISSCSEDGLTLDASFIGSMVLTDLTVQHTDTGFRILGGVTRGIMQFVLIDNGNFNNNNQSDISVSPSEAIVQLQLRNTYLSSTVKVHQQDHMRINSYIRSDRHQRIDTNYSDWRENGTVTPDSLIYDVLAPSMRITPLKEIGSMPMYVAVSAGHAPSISIRVRKSALADGQAYSGTQPILKVLANPAVGIMSEINLATMTVGNGLWETLGGTIPTVSGDSIITVVVVCDGSTGFINIDNFQTTETASNTGQLSFILNGSPMSVLGGGTNSIISVPIPMIRKKVI